jgi:hypothetical protein
MKSGGWPEKCHWTYREILSKLVGNSSNTDTWARTPVRDSGKKPALPMEAAERAGEMAATELAFLASTFCQQYDWQ